MIFLELIDNDYKYEIENIIQLFFQSEPVTVINDDKSSDFTATVTAQSKAENGGYNLTVKVQYGDKYDEQSEFTDDVNDRERILSKLVFNILSGFTGIYPKWGIQTGVRPTKLLRNLTEKVGEDKATDYFKNKLLVSNEKFQLALGTMKAQEKILKKLCKRSFSLYVSIPFCPSRCSYCSFISHDVSRVKKLVPNYVELLCVEIEKTAKIAKDLSLTLQTVYIGGGTPTSVSAEELRLIIEAVYNSFDTSNLLEFTVEAGRPDTVTYEKLKMLKECNVTRISINPQTLNEDVLREIRRNHTAEDFYNAFDLARKCGFDNINTDLIAGLPSDDVNSFKNTLNDIVKLSPECITVHTLSIKRSSRLVYKGEAQYSALGADTSKMLDFAADKLLNSGYYPYYLYRQSRMSGNNENIGWSKPGFEGLYNVFIMEEEQTILAVGAGASTKLVSDDKSKIERIFNYKYPYEYINDFDNILCRKMQINKFYN